MTYIYMCLVGLQFSEGISQSKATGRVVFSKKKSYHVLLHIIIIKKKPEMPLKLNGHAINQKKNPRSQSYHDFVAIEGVDVWRVSGGTAKEAEASGDVSSPLTSARRWRR